MPASRAGKQQAPGVNGELEASVRNVLLPLHLPVRFSPSLGPLSWGELSGAASGALWLGRAPFPTFPRRRRLRGEEPVSCPQPSHWARLLFAGWNFALWICPSRLISCSESSGRQRKAPACVFYRA